MEADKIFINRERKMTGWYCQDCFASGKKCPRFHDCDCGGPGIVWEDGWVECEPCARKRLKTGKEK